MLFSSITQVFLTPEERRSVADQIDEIFTSREVSDESAKKVKGILDVQHQQSRTCMSSSSDRKERILLNLINRKTQTNIAIQLCRGILKQFDEYTPLFQHVKSMAHKLHEEIFHFVKKFHSQFLKAEAIPEENATVLAGLNVEDQDAQLRDSQLGVGEHCYSSLLMCRRNKAKHTWMSKFFTTLRSAYKAGSKALMKLPITNKTLINLAALDPGLQRSEGTAHSIMAIAQALPNFVPTEDLDKLDGEITKYGCDDQISHLPADETTEAFRIDSDGGLR